MYNIKILIRGSHLVIWIIHSCLYFIFYKNTTFVREVDQMERNVLRFENPLGWGYFSVETPTPTPTPGTFYELYS